MARLIARPSPNHDARPPGQEIDILLLHYTGMPSAGAALDRLCDPTAKVSAHYCIDEDGTRYGLVPEDRRAWHAGAASWAGSGDINGRSIGIELVNPGHEFGYRAFPRPQMTALTELARDVLARHPIPPERVLGHSDVAPTRKEDPGELFDWAGLAGAGIGLWPGTPEAQAEPPTISRAQELLRRYGYAAPLSGALDQETQAVVRAFQRHFRPRAITGRMDRESAARLERLVALLDARRGNA